MENSTTNVLINELFSLRDGEVITLQSERGNCNIAVIARSVSPPDGPISKSTWNGKKVEHAAILATEWSHIRQEW